MTSEMMVGSHCKGWDVYPKACPYGICGFTIKFASFLYVKNGKFFYDG